LKFLIRDDDTCAATQPQELEACYGEIWDEIPICLSVTPFRVAESPSDFPNAPPELSASGEPMPLERNPELVEFLKDGTARGRLHVALHGYHHVAPGGRPEYVAGEDLERKTKHGKQYTESLLGCRISTFVPPNNTLSRQGYAAVVAAGLNVVNNQNYPRMRLGSLSAEALVDAALAARYSVSNRLGRREQYATRSYWRYKQAPYFTAGPAVALSELQAGLRGCPTGGVFVLATHYHAFERAMQSGESVGEAVRAIVDEARRIPGVEFVDYDRLW